MAETYESTGIVLDCREFRESSQLLTLLTPHLGRVDLVARGSRRAKGSPPDRFSLIHAVWTRSKEGGLGTLTRWELEEEFAPVRQVLVAYVLGSVWAEVAIAFTQSNNDETSTYALTKDFLSILASAPPHDLPVWGILNLMWRVLQVHGFLPSFEKCARCGSRRGASFFSWASMAPLCDSCCHPYELAYPLDSFLVRRLMRAPLLSRVDTFVARNFLCFYREYAQRILEKKLISFNMLFEVLGN
jgi:DNA repair protein RecO (recombination protein O)